MISIKKHMFFWAVFSLYLASYVLAASAGTLPKNYEVNPGSLQDGFQSVSSWTVAQSCGSTFTLNEAAQFVKNGSGSGKYTITAGNCGVTATRVVSQVFNHSLFGLWLYIDATNKNISTLTLDFCQNTTCSIRFSKALNTTNTKFIVGGWNWIIVHRDDFTNTGGNDWLTSQDRIRIAITTSSAGPGTFYIDDYYVGFYNRPKLILRFDDGSNTETNAVTSATNMGYPISLCVIGSQIGTAGSFTLSQLQTYQSQGHEICNHTWSHQNATTLGDTAFIADALEMQNYMKSNGLNAYDILAYPNSDPTTSKDLFSGYAMVAGESSLFYTTYSKGLASPYFFYLRNLGDPTVSVSTAVSHVKAAIKYGGLLIALFHNFQADPPVDTGNWSIERFDQFLQEVKRLEPQIDVVVQKEFIDGLANPRRRR